MQATIRNAAFGMTVLGMAVTAGAHSANAEDISSAQVEVRTAAVAEPGKSEMTRSEALKKMKQEFASRKPGKPEKTQAPEKTETVAVQKPTPAQAPKTKAPEKAETEQVATDLKAPVPGIAPQTTSPSDLAQQPSQPTDPATLSFAGNVPLPPERPVLKTAEVAQAGPEEVAADKPGKASKRLRDQAATSASVDTLTTAGSYRELVQRHASVHGLPFALADAVVRIESGYNPNAHNGGAIGLMQIMLPTARSLGYDGSAAGLTHPETNIKYGMIYLAKAYRMSEGDTCKTVMRYQSGHLTTRMSAANQAYCSRARMLIAQNNS